MEIDGCRCLSITKTDHSLKTRLSNTGHWRAANFIIQWYELFFFTLKLIGSMDPREDEYNKDLLKSKFFLCYFSLI